jgi:hypothetical protein
MSALIDRPAMARHLGVSIEKLYRELGDWMNAPINPFPKPILGRMRGERWSLQAIDRWIENGGFNAAPGAGTTTSQETNWAAQLDANADQIAGR